MVAFGSVLITFSTLSTVFGSRLSSRPYAVKERHVVPQKWTRLGRAPADTILELRIALKQSRFDELERHLYEGQLPSVAQLFS
jgi:tripeptidyl-peptidase-1